LVVLGLKMLLKMLKFFDADPGWRQIGSGMEKCGSGMEKVGSGIKHPGSATLLF